MRSTEEPSTNAKMRFSRDFYLLLEYGGKLYIQIKFKVHDRDLYFFFRGEFSPTIFRRAEMGPGYFKRLDLNDFPLPAKVLPAKQTGLKLSLHKTGCIHVQDSNRQYVSGQHQYPFLPSNEITDFFIFCRSDPFAELRSRSKLNKTANIVIPVIGDCDPTRSTVLFKFGVGGKNVGQELRAAYFAENPTCVSFELPFFVLYLSYEMVTDFSRRGLHLLLAPESA